MHVGVATTTRTESLTVVFNCFFLYCLQPIVVSLMIHLYKRYKLYLLYKCISLYPGHVLMLSRIRLFVTIVEERQNKLKLNCDLNCPVATFSARRTIVLQKVDQKSKL